MARLILLMGILLLVACGKGQNNTDNTNNKSATNADNTTQKQVQTNKPNGKGRGRWNKDKAAEQKIAINVEAETVYLGDAIAVFNTTTLLEADLESAVTSKASGIVLQLQVEVGDVVAQGDVLAVLESDMQKLRWQSATANYKKSLHNYERAKTLLEKGLTNQESVENLKFETQSLKTNLDQAQMDLDFTQITAPIAGVISKRNIKKGNLIQTNTEVYEIVNFDSIQAVINVPESKWGQMQTGLEVIYEFASINTTLKGEIVRIDPVVDSATGTFRAVLSIDAAGERLRPGLFGKVQIVLDKHEDAVLVTKNAVIREDADAYVYVVNADNTLSKTSIQLGYEMDESIEVLTGLVAGQQVVTTGKNNVSIDSTVEVIAYDD